MGRGDINIYGVLCVGCIVVGETHGVSISHDAAVALWRALEGRGAVCLGEGAGGGLPLRYLPAALGLAIYTRLLRRRLAGADDVYSFLRRLGLPCRPADLPLDEAARRVPAALWAVWASFVLSFALLAAAASRSLWLWGLALALPPLMFWSLSRPVAVGPGMAAPMLSTLFVPLELWAHAPPPPQALFPLALAASAVTASLASFSVLVLLTAGARDAAVADAAAALLDRGEYVVVVRGRAHVRRLTAELRRRGHICVAIRAS